MSVDNMPDERLFHFYENIRQQVAADSVHKYQFMAGQTVRHVRRSTARRDGQATIETHADRVAVLQIATFTKNRVRLP
jgi:hypothetical protein